MCPPLASACARARTFMHPCRLGTIYPFPQEPEAAGQLEDAWLMWVLGEMAELISTAELFAIRSQFPKVPSCYATRDGYPAPGLLFIIGSKESYCPGTPRTHLRLQRTCWCLSQHVLSPVLSRLQCGAERAKGQGNAWELDSLRGQGPAGRIQVTALR